MINLPELQHFLDKGIVQVKEKDNTLFDIAGFPHYENVVSNVYAYFLDPAKDHGLGSLFLDALQELLQTNFTFSTPEIVRECYSSNGGRIDLVIQEALSRNENEEKRESSVILIENKMYHDLLNDFTDYYNSFDAKYKKGVLLTIKKTKSLHPEFINITHEQLINTVFDNIGQLVLKVPYRTIFILNEFSKNLKNFTMQHEVNSYYQFYQKNQVGLKQIDKLKEELFRHMWSQVDEVPRLLNDLDLTLANKYSSNLRCYKSDKTDSVFFTVFPEIFNDNEPRITIVVELSKPGIERLDEINKIEFTEEEKSIRKDTKAIRTGWLHYACMVFPLKDNVDFENLGELIKDKIESTPLKSTFLKIKNVLA